MALKQIVQVQSWPCGSFNSVVLKGSWQWRQREAVLQYSQVQTFENLLVAMHCL
jgi:hypothetical protein